MTNDFIRHMSLGLISGCTLALAACGPNDPQAVQGSSPALEISGDCNETGPSATLRDANGTVIGRVSFTSDGETTLVAVSAELTPEQGGSIRGMHVHANDKPENGEGCMADPAQPASTHFVSVDGHYNPHGGKHGHHNGDLPAVFFSQAGEASMRFLTDQFQAEDLIGRAVILHEGADNYGNVPVGDAPNQYTPNDPAALELTANTGNAGARIACGVIE
jgi:superoxide dismutase, Cu-Zn family